MGRALNGVVDRLEGVDLSPRMLGQAAKTRAYAALHEGELVDFLSGRDAGEADLVTAADVFVYMADLAGALREARRVLRRDGFLAFTVQAHDGDGVVLGEDGRFAHGAAYLAAMLRDAGLNTVLFESVSTRHDGGEPVPGFLVVAER
jgi:predicted TPR repeat methyltransferase